MKDLSRNELLTLWCDELVGRSSKLGELTFPHHAHPRLSISNYKGKRNISDKLWEKFMTNMDLIESKEFEKQISIYKEIRDEDASNLSAKIINREDDIHNQTYYDLMQREFYTHMNTWLIKDRVAKLRMIDLAYLLNYDDCIDNNYASTFVTNLMKNNSNVSIEVDSNIRKLIPHIDKLISENHVFYIASSQNTEVCD